MSHQYDNTIRPVAVDVRNAPREQRKAYSRMKVGAGKGDGPRNCWSNDFRRNYISIFGKRKYD
jgi:hypothetical protein